MENLTPGLDGLKIRNCLLVTATDSIRIKHSKNSTANSEFEIVNNLKNA